MKRLTCLLAVVVGSTAVSSAMAVDRPVDFNRDVRPLLSDRCFACHGPDAEHAKGGLRLDIAESAYEKKKSGEIAIVPGDTKASSLVARIYTSDEDDLMPPADSHKKLDESEKAILKKWVEQGGSYDQPWAYVAPEAVDPPKVKRADWPANYIDAYILGRLEAEGLAPSEDADRATLIRRVTFDLTGLPPTPAEVDAFVKDTSADAYEKVVDRLLASEAYGERMTAWWLDLVRFADTVGYHGDQTHNIWPYRDYVINAFNTNKGFDTFTIEQLAGDLLPEPTQEQLLATAYNRLLQTTHEGGLQLMEYRAIYMADRVRNFSQVFMGATVGCAQCHSHKFDPYTHRDFHTLGAFFADIDDEEHLRNPYSGLNRLPTPRVPEMRVVTPSMTEQVAAKDAEIAAIDAKIAAARKSIVATQADLEAALRASIAANEKTTELIVDDGSVRGGKFDGPVKDVNDPVHSGGTSRRFAAVGQNQHVLRDISEPIEVRAGDTLYAWVRLDEKNPPTAIMLQFQVDGKDWEHRATWGGDQISFGRTKQNHAGYQRMGKLPKPGEWVRLEVAAAHVGLKPGQKITGTAYTQFDGLVHWDDAGVVRGSVVPDAVAKALDTPADKRSDKQSSALVDYLIERNEQAAALSTERAERVAEREKLDTGGPLVMYTKSLAEPRDVRILARGNWQDETGEIVQPAIPQFMGTLDTGGKRATRLDLAKWLVTPEADGGVAGLTARVQVNRFWQLMMGVGIARVLDDFGGQGEPPVHPELLDRLAVEFVKSGWDTKAMMRTIAMSRTYRQSSHHTSELLERDPGNRLYARQSSPRLPAESVRDNALAVSGLLVREIGGPSVNPYQPAGYYGHLNFPQRRYQQDNDQRQYRRGVYVHWQRQFLHPMMKAFDAPTREECTAARPESNTPTQALVLLNDPTFVEAARVFADRIVTEGGASDGSRLRYAFKWTTSREPTPQETAVLAKLLADHRAYYKDHGDEAAKLARVGLAPSDPKVNADERAAWTSVARTLLNLNETITRN